MAAYDGVGIEPFKGDKQAPQGPVLRLCARVGRLSGDIKATDIAYADAAAVVAAAMRSENSSVFEYCHSV